jgi:hypothetical protein
VIGTRRCAAAASRAFACAEGSVHDRIRGAGVTSAPQWPNRMHAPSLLQNIRLSSDGANPLNGSRNQRADGDGCVEFAPDAGVAHGLRV